MRKKGAMKISLKSEIPQKRWNLFTHSPFGHSKFSHQLMGSANSLMFLSKKKKKFLDVNQMYYDFLEII